MTIYVPYQITHFILINPVTEIDLSKQKTFIRKSLQLVKNIYVIKLFI